MLQHMCDLAKETGSHLPTGELIRSNLQTLADSGEQPAQLLTWRLGHRHIVSLLCRARGAGLGLGGAVDSGAVQAA